MTAEKAARYDTTRYQGATGRNWYTADPTLQFLMRSTLSDHELAWLEPHLERLGELIGGPVSARADRTDKDPPRLVKYDRWGHDVSDVLLPESVTASKRDLVAHRFTSPEMQQAAADAGVRLGPANAAYAYLLNQAEIGMMCALGTGGDMVQALVAEFAPDDIKAKVLPKFASGEWEGETAQLLTERTGGSDLGQLETTATPDGDAWRLDGVKWFASNANGAAYVVLAKPLESTDDVRGIATFLVLRERRDGSRNGVRIRRLKDKLGTKAVASAEVEFVGAEAFLLAPSGPAVEGRAGAAPGSGAGLRRMMEMTNGARLGIAMMGLGCARRALVESLCYASARPAFGKPLVDQPLMRRKLAELIVDVEAAQALVFDGYGVGRADAARPRLRIGAPVIKLKAARLGITAASDAVEIHGGNGYVEDWPVARILRDAQVNTIWEGPDNILCLDVRRGIEREQAHLPLLDRLRQAAASGPPGDLTAKLVSTRIDDLADAIEAWARLPREVGEARLFALTQFMGDVYAGALLVEQAGWEAEHLGTDRKALVARLYAERHLAEPDRLRGIDGPSSEALDRFDELVAGAFVA